MLTIPDIARAAADLEVAARSRTPIPPLTTRWPDMDVEDAYAIQLRGVWSAVRAGQRVVGYKIGLTSSAMQQQFGVLEPDFGHLLDGMRVADAGKVPVPLLCAPRAEPEIAFVLGDGISAPGASADDVLAATRALLPAIEIVDSRIADWRITLADTVADNASSGRFVVGARPLPMDASVLCDITVELRVNGAVVHTGLSSAVLGNPAHAVAWLANTLADHGVRTGPGDVILSGSCTQAVPVEPDDVVSAEFSARGSSLGSATVHFSAVGSELVGTRRGTS